MVMPTGRIPTRGSSSTPQITTLWNTLIQAPFDYLSVAYPDSVTEVYTFKAGGSGGTTVTTLTLVYVDASKASLSTLTKS